MTVDARADSVRVEPSSGGLATGLRGLHERENGLWIGWPGMLAPLSSSDLARVHEQLASQRLIPVELSADEVSKFYDGYCNSVLWPLLHYQPYQLPLEIQNWDAYVRVNQRFADAAAEHHRDGDVIWVHDYQLMLVPEMLRARLPTSRIGFFLHIPFPSSEIFRILPHRDELLRGLLGADLIGFHTVSYMRHFASALLLLLGASMEIDRVLWDGREVRLGSFGMGIDARAFAATADRPDVIARAKEVRLSAGETLLLGVDRLDYTKGIPRRLLAFERMLERHPELRGHVRLVQVGVPSREDVHAYQTSRSAADELIGRIHGAFATASWVPVHWLYRGVSRDELIALYRAADVMLVTPVRDGMNLVAKEFVASRTDEDGVLVLSEFAGAASELSEAISVNPFDIESTAAAFHRAVTLPAGERHERMRALRARVLSHDADHWEKSFMKALGDVGPIGRTGLFLATTEAELAEQLARLESAPARVLLLDYDGTLVPFARTPDEARPDPELLELLTSLAHRPATAVHVVSGRMREFLERWFADLPIGLHAEHGLWSREAGSKEWKGGYAGVLPWRESVLALLHDFTSRLPGSLIEEKSASLAWHYRAADREFGAIQAKELRIHLSETLSNVPVEVIQGHLVVEIRPHGVHKGRVFEHALPIPKSSTAVLAIGDDRTDEDLFAALPADAISIHVGLSASRARFIVRDVAAVRAFLQSLAGRLGAGTAR